ncbi:hypothetical protein EDC04DRAFT_630048 [Pisolithus marmoratus]|nr:hypothetical protein EDC04DRAFT_630048 [Pisolithus marmoratus]
MLVAMTDPQKQSTVTPAGLPNTDGAFQQALLKVRELETENAKLYEDNRRLAAAVHMLNERHAFLSKPQAAQLQQLMYLQELIRNIETDRLRATRQHQEILSSLANGTTSQLLVTQLQQSRVEYTHLLKEYNYLLDRHTKLKVHLSMVNPTHMPSHVPPGAPVVANHPAAIFPQRPDIYIQGDPSRDVPGSHTPHFPLPQQVIQNIESWSFDGFAQRQTPVRIQYPVASLPTPPSSASMAAPAGPPLHSPLRPVTRHPVKPPVHIPQLPAAPRIMSAPATLPQSYHPFPQGPKPVRGPHEVVDLTKAESIPPLPHVIPRPVQSPSASMSPSSVKRSSSILGASASPEVDVKRPRVEGSDQSPPDNRVVDDSPPSVQCFEARGTHSG